MTPAAAKESRGVRPRKYEVTRREPALGSHRARALALLRQDPFTPAELREALGVSTSHLRSILQHLEMKDLITRDQRGLWRATEERKDRRADGAPLGNVSAKDRPEPRP